MADKPVKILFFGDIVGKIGRRAVAQIIPQWQAKYHPDVILANVENLAHGKGVTVKSLTEMREAGIDAFTGGNHIWSKEDPSDTEISQNFSLALPANSPLTPVSTRWKTVTVGKHELYILNLLGQFQMEGMVTTNPFTAFDEICQAMGQPKLLLVDFHAETTSEKVAMGLYLNGRASAVLGSHTHVPTADARVLSQGTGYISDLGMAGGQDTVLGVKSDIIINRFKGENIGPFDWPETGPAVISAVYLELDPATGRCLQIEPLHATITV